MKRGANETPAKIRRWTRACATRATFGRTDELGTENRSLALKRSCAKATVAARLLRAWFGGVLGRGGEFFQVVVYDFGDSDLFLVLLQSQELLELFS